MIRYGKWWTATAQVSKAAHKSMFDEKIWRKSQQIMISLGFFLVSKFHFESS